MTSGRVDLLTGIRLFFKGSVLADFTEVGRETSCSPVLTLILLGVITRLFLVTFASGLTCLSIVVIREFFSGAASEKGILLLFDLTTRDVPWASESFGIISSSFGSGFVVFSVAIRERLGVAVSGLGCLFANAREILVGVSGQEGMWLFVRVVLLGVDSGLDGRPPAIRKSRLAFKSGLDGILLLARIGLGDKSRFGDGETGFEIFLTENGLADLSPLPTGLS